MANVKTAKPMDLLDHAVAGVQAPGVTVVLRPDHGPAPSG